MSTSERNWEWKTFQLTIWRFLFFFETKIYSIKWIECSTKVLYLAVILVSNIFPILHLLIFWQTWIHSDYREYSNRPKFNKYRNFVHMFFMCLLNTEIDIYPIERIVLFHFIFIRSLVQFLCGMTSIFFEDDFNFFFAEL